MVHSVIWNHGISITAKHTNLHLFSGKPDIAHIRGKESYIQDAYCIECDENGFQEEMYLYKTILDNVRNTVIRETTDAMCTIAD